MLFNKPIQIPGDDGETIDAYGLNLDYQLWQCRFVLDYIYYIIVIAELHKEGVIFKDSRWFENDGVCFGYQSPEWNEYEDRVVRSPSTRFAVVDSDTGLDEGDCLEMFLTNKEKWAGFIEKGDLEWI